MDFLKALFEDTENKTLSYEQFTKSCKDAGIKLADLSKGDYVAKQKYEDDIKSRETTIADLNKTIETRDTDLADIQKKLNNAGEDKAALEKLNGDLTALQSKYDTDTKEYQAKLSKQAYEFAVKEFASTKKFTSNAAKRDFIQSMTAKSLHMENDKILGAEDFVTAYSQDNGDAFVVDKPDDNAGASTPSTPQPAFVGSTPGPATGNDNQSTGFNFNFAGVRAHDKK